MVLSPRSASSATRALKSAVNRRRLLIFSYSSCGGIHLIHLSEIPGPAHSDFSVEAALTLGAVFGLALRQTEGFIRSLLELMGLDLPVPDHTTLVRRRRHVSIDMNAPGRKAPVDLVLDSTGLKFFGAGEWDRFKHGEKRRSWRKLHILLDAGTGEILAHRLTDDDTSDAAMAGPLVEDSGGWIRSVISDDAYDGAPVHAAIRAAWPERSPPKIAIPPPRNSISPPGQPNGGSTRECHAAEIAAHGRMAWQKKHGYGQRSMVETAILRLKRLSNDGLSARSFGAQCQEIALVMAAANKMVRDAKPIIVRVS
ncbi:MAG: IS5 family transposase [Thiolinea sp.]